MLLLTSSGFKLICYSLSLSLARHKVDTHLTDGHDSDEHGSDFWGAALFVAFMTYVMTRELQDPGGINSRTKTDTTPDAGVHEV